MVFAEVMGSGSLELKTRRGVSGTGEVFDGEIWTSVFEKRTRVGVDGTGVSSIRFAGLRSGDGETLAGLVDRLMGEVQYLVGDQRRCRRRIDRTVARTGSGVPGSDSSSMVGRLVMDGSRPFRRSRRTSFITGSVMSAMRSNVVDARAIFSKLRTIATSTAGEVGVLMVESRQCFCRRGNAFSVHGRTLSE